MGAVTTTTVLDPHRGAVLPAARIVVIAVPVIVIIAYVFVVVRKRES